MFTLTGGLYQCHNCMKLVCIIFSLMLLVGSITDCCISFIPSSPKTIDAHSLSRDCAKASRNSDCHDILCDDICLHHLCVRPSTFIPHIIYSNLFITHPDPPISNYQALKDQIFHPPIRS